MLLALPTLVAIVVNLLVFQWLVRRDLRTSFLPPDTRLWPLQRMDAADRLVIVALAVVAAADDAGLRAALGAFGLWAVEFGGLAGLFGVVAGTAVGTNLVNNWSMALAIAGPLDRADASETLLAGSMLGAGIGLNLPVVRLLATLIWLTEARRGRLAVSARAYLRLGLITTIPTLAAATIVLGAISQFTL